MCDFILAMNIQTRKTISTLEQLDALAWAANRSGKSYGTFTAKLTSDEKKRIYGEYIAWQEAEAAARAERARIRRRTAPQREDDWEDTMTPIDDGDIA